MWHWQICMEIYHFGHTENWMMQLQNCLKYVLRGKRSTNPIRKKSALCVVYICTHIHTISKHWKKFWRRVRQIYDSHTVHYKKTPKSAKKFFVFVFQSLSSLISVESYFIFKAIYICTILTVIQCTDIFRQTLDSTYLQHRRFVFVECVLWSVMMITTETYKETTWFLHNLNIRRHHAAKRRLLA